MLNNIRIIGVERGECFGLLGTNGAGKTSTFRMLTGDASISSGDAFVHGLSLKTRVQDVYRHIGKITHNIMNPSWWNKEEDGSIVDSHCGDLSYVYFLLSI